MKTPRTPFVDAQDLGQSNPDTFYAPEAGELAGFAVGDYVKVCTEGERFWVEVQARTGDTVQGRVANDLVRTERHGLVCDDVVTFETRHIYAIEAAEPPKPAGSFRP